MLISEEDKISVREDGYTLVELLVVVVILVIAALLAVPMLSSAADAQLNSAANMIASDLEYTKSLAIGYQQNYSVVFDATADSYEVHDSSGTVISHPGRPNSQFIVNLGSDSRFNRVRISAADFDTNQTITFDYLGSPYSGTGTSSPLNNGQISIQAEGVTVTVAVEPETGYISIQ